MEELLGCWREAQRADKVAESLLRCRTILDLEFYDQISAVLREVESASSLLRDIYDLFPIYRSRVPIIIYYLNLLLPSMCRSMKEMMFYLEHDGLPARAKWTVMSERLSEQGGMTLAARFIMFSELLVQIIRLLSRSSLYDATSLELLRLRILRLRTLQHIPAPLGLLKPHVAPFHPTEADLVKRHWAEKVFEDRPHSTTRLKHTRNSQCFGPPMVDTRLDISPGSQVLFKLPFDGNRLSVTFYLLPDIPDTTRILCRWMDNYYNPLYACYGIHELQIRRKGSSLQFRRVSKTRVHPTIWLALFFKTWERMILFHCCFTAAKFRCPLTPYPDDPDDHVVGGESILFRGITIDDGFEHMLSVLQEKNCGGTRLLASIRNGDLKNCPVWTAFVTQQSTSPQWMNRRSAHRIWLKDLSPYVFCEKYKKRHQLRRDGEFEIYFVNISAADAFQDIFSEKSDTLSLTDHHEAQAGDISTFSASGHKDSLTSEPVKDGSVNSKSSDGDTESDLKVSQWQNDIENPSNQEDLSALLFEDCVKVFSLVFNIICEKPDKIESSFRDDLREEFRKFYVWNDTFPTASGELGSILSTSRNLKEVVYGLMVQWARALCKVPRVLIGWDWGPVVPEIAKLEVVSSKMGQVVAALSRATFALDEHDIELRTSLISDDMSDSASVESLGTISDIIEEMKLCTECLVDLLPSLENPAKDVEVVELNRAPETIPEESQPWWPFFLRAEDKFPSAERNLVVIIGQSIWRRWEKIRLSHATKAEALGIEALVYKPESVSDVESQYSNSAKSFDQDTQTTKTTFSGSSIFDKSNDKVQDSELKEYINPNARLRRQDSFSSVRSSLFTNASKLGQQRVPSMPKECRNGDEFECFVCQKRITGIQGPEAWRKHFFGDLEPYICTIANCPAASKTFKSRLEWSKHESTAHEAEFQKRLEAAVCPLCLKAINPVKQLSRHIGRHLRELSLASLPPGRTSAEEEEQPKKEILDRQAPDKSLHGLVQGAGDETSNKGGGMQGEMASLT